MALSALHSLTRRLRRRWQMRLSVCVLYKRELDFYCLYKSFFFIFSKRNARKECNQIKTNHNLIYLHIYATFCVINRRLLSYSYVIRI